VVSKVVLDVIPPFTLLSLRLALAAVVLGAAAWLKARLPRSAVYASTHPSVDPLLSALAAGLVGYGFSLGLQFVGTRLSTAANAALVTSASPAFIVLFAFLILREAVTVPRLLALILASLGVLVVIDPRTASLSRQALWGNLALAGAALTWGLYSVLVKRAAGAGVSTLTFTLAAILGGLPLSLPAAALELRAAGLGKITPGIVWGVIYLGVVSTALAAYLWNKSFELLDAGLASLFFFAQPVVGAALGWWLLGETLSAGFFWGGALIGISIFLAAWRTETVRLESYLRKRK